AVPASGPWATPAPAADLYALYDLDRGRFRLNELKCDVLQQASERGRAADLRHVGPFLELLVRGYGPMAELLFREVLPFYGRALHRASDTATEAAAAALRQSGEAAVPVLLGLLASDQWDDWRTALRALGELGSAARGAVPTLLSMLADEERLLPVIEALGGV